MKSMDTWLFSLRAEKNLMKDIRKMPASERLRNAQMIVEELTKRVEFTLALREQNTIILNSTRLSQQIPRSYAGNAFRVFQETVMRFEIINICGLWDKPEEGTISLPMAAVYLNSDEVLCDIRQSAFHRVREVQTHWMSGNAELIEIFERTNKFKDMKCAVDAFNREGRKISAILRRVDKCERGETLRSLRDVRHHFAHNLKFTRESKRSEIQPITHAEVHGLLEESISLIELLSLKINNVYFSIDNQLRELLRDCAEDLWNNCTFSIKEL